MSLWPLIMFFTVIIGIAAAALIFIQTGNSVLAIVAAILPALAFGILCLRATGPKK